MGSDIGFLMVMVVVVLTMACKFGSFSEAEFVRLERPLRDDGSLRLLVLGDWGRKGFYNQSMVAYQMGKIGEDLDIDFVISTGDNFYDNGLEDVHDKLFEESFTNIYTAKSLQKQWYSVLGNHDYRGNVLAQIDPFLQKIDRRWFCMRSFVLDAEIVEFFFVDTTPFSHEYWSEKEVQRYDWRNVEPRNEYISKLLKDLDYALKESSAKWKFVVGHHAIRSVSEHGDTEELVEHMLPILKANDVDLYINGHDHCLEHISSKDSPIQFLTSGGGSKAWRGSFTPNSDKLRFFYDGQGFMSLEITKDVVHFSFYDVFGKVIYEDNLLKELHSSV